MNMLVKFLLNAVAVLVGAYLLPGVYVEGFLTAFVIAVVLGLLNVTIKPLLIILTIPATVLTLGLFLLVINAVVIMIADSLVSGFAVDNFWWALLFSIILWLINSLFKDISGDKDRSARTR